MSPKNQVLKLKTPKYIFRPANISDPKISEMCEIRNPKISCEHPRPKKWSVPPLGCGKPNYVSFFPQNNNKQRRTEMDKTEKTFTNLDKFV